MTTTSERDASAGDPGAMGQNESTEGNSATGRSRY
jgi:hypothetical protein